MTHDVEREGRKTRKESGWALRASRALRSVAVIGVMTAPLLAQDGQWLMYS